MDGVSARAKRRWLLRWWFGQAAVVYFGTPVLLAAVFGAKLDFDVFFEREYAAWMLGILAAAALLQWLILLPVREPAADGRRRRLFWSMTAGGLVFATLAAGAAAAVVGVLEDVVGAGRGVGSWAPWAVLGVFAMNWLAATPMLLAFTDREADAEDRVLAVATRLFAGTAVEVLSAIPLDFLARRKNDCVCGRGTFWAAVFGFFAALALCGPVAFVVLLRRRRRRWPGGRCAACGADVGLDLRVPRCPSCGAGWAE